MEKLVENSAEDLRKSFFFLAIDRIRSMENLENLRPGNHAENLHGKFTWKIRDVWKISWRKIKWKISGIWKIWKICILAENLENLEIKPLFYAENLHYYVEKMEKSTLLCR